MAYSGRYKVKSRSKYKGNPDNVVFRSLWERNAFKWCDDTKEVKYWVSEEVVIPYLWEVDKKYHRYFMDLKITFTNGNTILVEIKPEKETKPPAFNGKKTKRYINEGLTYIKNMNKWSAAQEYAADRGWGFEIWTENKLSIMGILPKPKKTIKPIKKLKPLPAPKKRKK
mgnify:CR=1 FL=1|tara:strand:+ start:53 stop:559 length:507 start_codon:yes stop_codon:yes gene_type:complete